jgi:hypothetical protein
MFRIHGTICHLCGHDGATVADHLIPYRERPDLIADVSNMRPAHGTRRQLAPGNVYRDARCQVCLAEGKTGSCNGSRGAGSVEAARAGLPEDRASRQVYKPPVVMDGSWHPGQAWVPPIVL